MDLTTRYMGLDLKNPLVASASPLNADLGNLKRLEDLGTAAVVLPSLFEEQIEADAARYDHLTDVNTESSPEAQSYFLHQPTTRSGRGNTSTSFAERAGRSTYPSSPA